MINTITIVGNLGQDPEIRYTPNAVPVAKFTIAVKEVYKGKDGQKVKKVHWFRVTAFKRLAEIVGQYCTKGSKVGVRGQLQYRQWQDNEGVNTQHRGYPGERTGTPGREKRQFRHSR